MGKKNRNRGGSRGRYDDMFDYAGGNDEDYQYSYQDEIDSAEFVDVENPSKDSRSRETMHSAEKNTKSQAAEERESWDFIKAKMDQSLSRLGSAPASRNSGDKTEKTSACAPKEEKEKKPKGPSVIAVFFGKMKSFTATSFKKVTSVFKRKPKPEKSVDDSGKNKQGEKNGFASRAFSFLKKKTTSLTDTEKSPRKKIGKSNSSVESAVSKDTKPALKTQLRERRKTYLIIGSITMCIVLLLLTAGILLIITRSGKPGKTVAQNQETAETENPAKTSQNDGLSVPGTTTTSLVSNSQSQETGKETTPPSPDADLDLPGLIDDLAADPTSEPKAEKKGKEKEEKTPAADELSPDLTVADIVNSDANEPDTSTDLADSLDSLVNEVETRPADEKEEKAEDPLAALNDLPELDTSGNDSEPGDLSDLASLTDSTPETDPLKSNDSANTSMQEETPSLNETAAPEKEEKDSASESSPSLLDLPESISPGSTTVSPTISRSEDQNQPPEEMGTPDGVTPGSNIDAWNTDTTEVADSAPSSNSLDLNAPDSDPLNEKKAESASPSDDLTAALAPPADSPSQETSQSKESGSDGGLSDFGQLSDLDSSPAPAPPLDPDLGSGDPSPSSEMLKGQKSPKYTNYTSLKDDTFWKISEKFYETPAYEKALSRYNSDVVPDPSNLKEGTVLQIPDVNFLRSCYPTLCPQPLQVVQVPTSSNPDQTRGIQYYCVAEGDTLSLIAERFLGDSSRWPEIYRMNASKIQEMDLVQPGVKLRIPADDAIPEQNIWQ